MELAVALDREVVPCVLAERQEHLPPRLAERKNNGERRTVADVLRVSGHVVRFAYEPDATMQGAPE
jgi:hypothetical protein